MHMRDLPQRKKMFILSGVLLAMLLGALDANHRRPGHAQHRPRTGRMAMLSWSSRSTRLRPRSPSPSWASCPTCTAVNGSTWAASRCSWRVRRYPGRWRGVAELDLHHPDRLAERDDPADHLPRDTGRGRRMMMANGMAIIGDLFDPRERGRYQGLMGGVFGSPRCSVPLSAAGSPTSLRGATSSTSTSPSACSHWPCSRSPCPA